METEGTESTARLTFAPATAERWEAIEALFGPRGACGGCWCMHWLLPRRVYDAQKGDGNKASFRRLIEEGAEPGLLAAIGDEPVAWCAVGPRERYGTLQRSRVLAPVDDAAVWSIVCLFVARRYRRQGITLPLIGAAVEFAAARGARIVEAYPVEPRSGELPPPFAWTGIASTFRRAGFVEVARRSPTRPIMRCGVPEAG